MASVHNSNPEEIIENWEKDIKDKDARNIKTLYLMGISFSSLSVVNAVKHHFSSDDRYYDVSFEKCRTGLWDIIIRWSNLD